MTKRVGLEVSAPYSHWKTAKLKELWQAINSSISGHCQMEEGRVPSSAMPKSSGCSIRKALPTWAAAAAKRSVLSTRKFAF